MVRSPVVSEFSPVSQAARRLRAGWLVLLPLAALAFGCGQKTDTPAPAVVIRHASQTPCEIQLTDAKVTVLEPTLVQFEVTYRFTHGQPDKYYSCDILFPGTPNHGVRMLESWELKEEGMIRDRIVLTQPGVKSFEIRMSESPSPRDPYKTISNTLGGSVH